MYTLFDKVSCSARRSVAVFIATFCFCEAVDQTKDPHCGLTWDTEFRDEREAAFVYVSDLPDPDIEDRVWSVESASDYRAIRRACTAEGKVHQAGIGADCINFGPAEWNYSFEVLLQEGSALTGKRPCAHDLAAIQPVIAKASCGESIACKMIDNEIRIVGLRLSIRNDKDMLIRKHMNQLPYLFSLSFGSIDTQVFSQYSDFSLPATLESIDLVIRDDQIWPIMAPIIRSQQNFRNVFIHGRQDALNWINVDLSLLCGLNLKRFAGYTINAGEIPACWSGMQHLESLYCTNCMLTRPPVALKGLLSLRSFVAFRQFEMIPCAVQRLSQSPQKCKAGWETRRPHAAHDDKNRVSNGRWGDFQEGPSWLCPDSSFSFPFQDLVNLGWQNIEKVWLDGNFLTGPIPTDIGSLWPRLRSLDLYDNDLSGPIPASLGSLDMVKLQLHGNNFSGKVPNTVMELLLKRHVYFGISDNPLLKGCLPRRRLMRGDAAVVPFMNTEIGFCDVDEL